MTRRKKGLPTEVAGRRRSPALAMLSLLALAAVMAHSLASAPAVTAFDSTQSISVVTDGTACLEIGLNASEEGAQPTMLSGAITSSSTITYASPAGATYLILHYDASIGGIAEVMVDRREN